MRNFNWSSELGQKIVTMVSELKEEGKAWDEIVEIVNDEFDLQWHLEKIRKGYRMHGSSTSPSPGLSDALETEASIYDEDFEVETEESIMTQIEKLRKSRQNLMDQNRVLRAMFRERDRVESTSKVLLQHILKSQKARDPLPFKQYEYNNSDVKRVGIVQFSDWHLVESVLDIDTKGKNKYDFSIAAKRMQKYAYRIKEIFKTMGITDIAIAFTGDQFNSNRRKTEIIRNLKALSEGFVIGTDLVSQFVADLAMNFYIEIFSVFGNESRLDDDIQAIDFHNNFDFLLHHFLESKLRDFENIYFHEIEPDHELYTEINGARILFMHGHVKKKAHDIIVKYTKMNKIVDMIIRGHNHNLMLSESLSQSGSGVGDSAYNFQMLQAVARASQNIYVVTNDNSEIDIQPMPIDLQKYSRFDGYNIPRDANDHSVRTARLKGRSRTVVRVVI